MAVDLPLHLDWNIRHENQQLAIAPALSASEPLLLRYELSTVNQPSRRIRQAGSAELKAGETHTLTRLVIAPVSTSCPLRLVLTLPDGSTQDYSIDPCITP